MRIPVQTAGVLPSFEDTKISFRDRSEVCMNRFRNLLSEVDLSKVWKKGVDCSLENLIHKTKLIFFVVAFLLEINS